jgi:hypothetical protein
MNTYNVYLPLIYKGNVLKMLGTQIEGTLKSQYIAPKAWVHRAIRWFEVEPSEGNIIWTPRMATDWNFLHNRNMMWGTRGCAEYARKIPEYSNSPPKKKYYANFATMCNKLIADYHVTHIEIWNEPDTDPAYMPPEHRDYYGGWGLFDDPIQGGLNYGNFLKVVYPLIKQAHPKTTVVAGALAMSEHTDPFIQGFTSIGNYFDAISYHAYCHWGAGYEALKINKQRIRKYSNKPLYCTETSLLKHDGITNPQFEQDQANYWVYVIKLGFDIKLDGLFWYSMDSQWLCSNMVDGSRRKPVWYNYHATLS